MRGRCCIYDLGTWFHLDRLCSVTQSPVHTTFSRERFIYLTGNVWPITSWNSMPYTRLYIKEASRRAQDNWTFLLGLCPKPVWAWARGLDGPGPKASMGFGISVPCMYNCIWFTVMDYYFVLYIFVVLLIYCQSVMYFFFPLYIFVFLFCYTCSIFRS